MSSSIARVDNERAIPAESMTESVSESSDASQLFGLLLGGMIGSGDDSWNDLAAMTRRPESSPELPDAQLASDGGVDAERKWAEGSTYNSFVSDWKNPMSPLSTASGQTDSRGSCGDDLTGGKTPSAMDSSAQSSDVATQKNAALHHTAQTSGEKEVSTQQETKADAAQGQKTETAANETTDGAKAEVTHAAPDTAAGNEACLERPAAASQSGDKQADELVEELLAEEEVGDEESDAAVQDLVDLVEQSGTSSVTAEPAGADVAAVSSEAEAAMSAADMSVAAAGNGAGTADGQTSGGSSDGGQDASSKGGQSEESILAGIAAASRARVGSFSSKMADAMMSELQTATQDAGSTATGMATGASVNVAGTSSVNIQLERIQDLVRRFDEHLLSMIKTSDSEMTMTISPEKYGKLVVSCKETDDGLAVQVQAQNPAVCDLLTQETDGIKQFLQQSGYRLSGFDVFSGNGESFDRGQQAGSDYDGREEAGLPRWSGGGSQGDDMSSDEVATSSGTGITDQGVWFLA